MLSVATTCSRSREWPAGAMPSSSWHGTRPTVGLSLEYSAARDVSQSTAAAPTVGSGSVRREAAIRKKILDIVRRKLRIQIARVGQ